MAKYRRVTFEDRSKIDAFLQGRFSVPWIAQTLGFHKSTLYRELDRNFLGISYSPTKANDASKERYLLCRRPYKLKGKIKDFIVNKIMLGWSPEQITGRLNLEKSFAVSHQTIYRFLKTRPDLKPLLRRPKRTGAGRFLQRKSRAKHGTSIRKRPLIVKKRQRLGDWERDTMFAKDRKAILVCVDRKSRLSKIDKIDTFTSQKITQQTRKLLRSTKKLVHTVTSDNGSEFRGPSKLPFPTYYCDPFAPHQRGSVENLIGLLRQYISLKTDLTQISSKQIKYFERILNNRPRKCLDYRTPYEVFYRKKVALALLI